MKRGDHVVIIGVRGRHRINEPVYIAKIVDIDAFHCLVEIIKSLDGYIQGLDGYVHINTSMRLFQRKFVKPLNYLKMYENRN